MSPVIVNRVEVMEFCYCCLCTCESVIFIAAQVRITVEEYWGQVIRVERVAYVIGVPEERREFTACGKSCMEERRLHASIKVQAELVQREVSVVAFDSAVLGDIKRAGTAKVAVGVLVIGKKAVPLSRNSRATFAFVVAIKPEADSCAKSFLVRPFDSFIVEVDVCPIVADCCLQCIDALENAVASGTRNGLCCKGVVACF